MKRGFCLSRGVGLFCFFGLIYAYGGITGPTFDATFSPSQIGPGSISTLTFTINNVTGDPVEDMAFSTTLPAGLLFAPSSIPQTTCQEATLAFDDPINPTTLTFSGRVLGIDQSCTVTVSVIGPATGNYNFISGSLKFWK